MYTSGFWLLPRTTGRSGDKPRWRCARSASRSTRSRICSADSDSIVLISCDVRKPSWKCMIGTRAFSVARWETSAMSWQSCTDWLESMAQPQARAAITSWWSPKMDRASPAIARAATWMTQGINSPAILYMLGIISSKPCEEVKVVPRPPAATEPCNEPAAPASDCSCCTFNRLLKMFLTPATDHASQISAMGEDGVIGKMKASSDMAYATWEAAVQPSHARMSCCAFGFVVMAYIGSLKEEREVSPGRLPPSAPAPAMCAACDCRNIESFSSSADFFPRCCMLWRALRNAAKFAAASRICWFMSSMLLSCPGLNSGLDVLSARMKPRLRFAERARPSIFKARARACMAHFVKTF
mmetsp:Transcript_96340/g.311064  ORF Transcript_96340/g.311064 Transcript_96340/m.311064 type:complete len:355 (-) Transcript_96340:53-1117(-)